MDPISDILTQIRNAQAVKKEMVSIPFSNLKYSLAQIIEREGFFGEVKKTAKKTKRKIEIHLKYEEKEPRISNLKVVSKPGQRVYKKHNELYKVKNGYGIAIVSTSRGLMTNKEAKKKKIGGEILCEIW